MTTEPAAEARRALAEKTWSTAKVWDYSISHSMPRVRLDESPAGLLLHDCDRVSFEPAWEIGELKIAPYDSSHGIRYTVSDGEHLHVDCGQVYFVNEMEL